MILKDRSDYVIQVIRATVHFNTHQSVCRHDSHCPVSANLTGMGEGQTPIGVQASPGKALTRLIALPDGGDVHIMLRV